VQATQSSLFCLCYHANDGQALRRVREPDFNAGFLTEFHTKIRIANYGVVHMPYGSWLLVESGHGRRVCDDVASAREVEGGTVLCLADGATGVGEGFHASTAFAEAMQDVNVGTLWEPGGLAAYIFAAEVAILQGEHDCDTTGIVAVCAEGIVYGCSAGDSQAWLIDRAGGHVDRLTAGQNPRPRIGSGARPVTWEPRRMEASTLLVASDCVFDWLSHQQIVGIVQNVEEAQVPQALRNAIVRACGYLPDDFSAICHLRL
jgi:serine/threonine protein phosphatase PrpC